MPSVRFVVFHRPGPAWQPGVPPLEQPGIGAHSAHYRRLLDDGRLHFGGPFVDAVAGGMMCFDASISRDEADRLAGADPAVASGLLAYEVRPWLAALGG